MLSLECYEIRYKFINKAIRLHNKHTVPQDKSCAVFFHPNQFHLLEKAFGYLCVTAGLVKQSYVGFLIFVSNVY